MGDFPRESEQLNEPKLAKYMGVNIFDGLYNTIV
jgi:hypothetical protein